MTTAHRTIDAYIRSHPAGVQKILREIQRRIAKILPKAAQCMSYGIPTFDLAGQHVVHFAAFKKHIGFYPTSSGISAFREQLGSYKHSRGAVQFPLDQPIPYALIAKITAFRKQEVTQLAGQRRPTTRRAAAAARIELAEPGRSAGRGSATRADRREAAGPRSKSSMKKSEPQKSESPSELIDARIKELGDWRGKLLSRLRALIQQADPEVVEEWKWRGVPVWSHDGLICTGETYKNVVKMTFAKGAGLPDPAGLFNASLEGNTRRAIDFHEGAKIDAAALKSLIRAAVTLNKSTAQRGRRR